MLKISGKIPDFKIIETLRWDCLTTKVPGAMENRGFFLLKRHIERMAHTAALGGFCYDESKIRDMLEQEEKDFTGATYRVRLLISYDGTLELTSTDITDIEGDVTFDISQNRTYSNDPFLLHKTTRRDLYNMEYKRALSQGLFDTVFTNERGEVTEGAISNIYIKNNDNSSFITPPVKCGLLPGTLRAELIETGKAIEGIIFPKDLNKAQEIFIGNSVRGILRAKMLPINQKNN